MRSLRDLDELGHRVDTPDVDAESGEVSRPLAGAAAHIEHRSFEVTRPSPDEGEVGEHVAGREVECLRPPLAPCRQLLCDSEVGLTEVADLFDATPGVLGLAGTTRLVHHLRRRLVEPTDTHALGER